jgi:hypothetical protein
LIEDEAEAAPQYCSSSRQVGECSERTLLGHEDVTVRASFYRYGQVLFRLADALSLVGQGAVTGLLADRAMDANMRWLHPPPHHHVPLPTYST